MADRLLGGIAVLAGGTAISQAITVLAAPFLARLNSPADFGRLGLLLSFVNVASVAVCLRFEVAIVTARTDREGAQLATLAMRLLPATTLVAAAVFAGLILLHVGAYGELPAVWTLIPLLTLPAIGLAGVLRYWILRQQGYSSLAQLAMVQGATRAGSQLVLGILHWGGAGLALGDAFGRIAGVVTLGSREIPRILGRAGSLRGLTGPLFKRHWRFPAYSMPSSLLDSLAAALPVPLIGAQYGLHAAGEYVLVQTIIGLPVTLISGSVADVFHSRMAALARTVPAEAGRLFSQTLRATAAIGAAIALAMAVLAPWIFPVVFGDEWATAGLLAVILSPRVFMQITVSPVSRVVYIFEGQRGKLLFDAAVICGTVGTLAAASLLELPFRLAIVLLVVSDVIAYAVYGIILARLTAAGTREVSTR